MSVEIVTVSAETHEKGVLEQNGLRLLVLSLEEHLAENYFEPWEIGLAQNMLETLSAQLAERQKKEQEANDGHPA